ncbi:MAG: AsmA-like C-terminal region-containing protein, partial [Candidatus Krumholzibacteria bacterium]|nr:AsmA-like C-terminal region-containing protein [Candidatus Krumholzibacteria bacterium]
RSGRSAAAKVPVEMSGGTFGFSAEIDGLAKEPMSMNLSFECAVEDLSVKAGTLASIAKVNAGLKGQGVAIAWKGLFPAASSTAAPADISLAWQAVKLDGEVKLEGGDFEIQNRSSEASAAAEPSQAQPIRISALKVEAAISGPNVRKLSGEFNIGSSPYRFEASMMNIMPAAAELALIAKRAQGADQKTPLDLGTVLDRLANAPVVKLEMNGRSFDARPYEKQPSGASKEDNAAALATSQTSATAQSAAEQNSAAAAGSGAVLFLKNTTFTAKLDSIIAREAVLTKVEVKGTVRDGRVKVDPATFAYAGGSGKTVLSADLRKAGRVEMKIDFSADGIEAGQALAHFNAIGGLVQGKFSVSSNAALVSGSGIDFLKTLSAAGTALSSKGTVSFERFVEPLTNIQGFDVTPFKRFDFNDWRGNFVVKDGRFITDNWKIKSSRGDWSIKGSFGFDGTLDYAVHVVIPPDVQKMMNGIDRYKNAFDLMRDKSGNLVLDIKLAGTASRPAALLDLTQAKGKVQDKVIDELKKRFLR